DGDELEPASRLRRKAKLIAWHQGEARAKPERALPHLSAVIELEPDRWQHYAERAKAYGGYAAMTQGSDRNGLAIKDYSRAIELKGAESWLWRERGLAYQRKREWDKAVADFSVLIGADLQNPAGWGARARAHVGACRWEEALEDYSKAIELNPRS